MLDFFPFLVSIWVLFFSPLWLAFVLVFLVLMLSGFYISYLSWFSFMIILLWVNGLLVLVIYISSVGSNMNNVSGLFLLFVFLLTFNKVFVDMIYFIPTLNYCFSMYVILFVFLLLVCIFLVEIFMFFGLGSFRM